MPALQRSVALRDVGEMKTVVVWQVPPGAYGSEFVSFDDRTFDALRDWAQSIADGAAATVAEVAPTVEAG